LIFSVLQHCLKQICKYRKTFGRAIFEKSEDNSEMALIKLSEVFGHSNTQITRRYLGLKTEEILSAYDLLSF